MDRLNLSKEVLENAIGVHRTFEKIEPFQPIDIVAVQAMEELLKYKNAEEQGLLLRLPCKIGDTVYVKLASYCDSKYAEAEVRDFTHFTSCGFCIVVTSEKFDKQNIPFSEFGKTVFLTKEETEQKLKETLSK